MDNFTTVSHFLHQQGDTVDGYRLRLRPKRLLLLERGNHAVVVFAPADE
jgi:hypothetical protein